MQVGMKRYFFLGGGALFNFGRRFLFLSVRMPFRRISFHLLSSKTGDEQEPNLFCRIDKPNSAYFAAEKYAAAGVEDSRALQTKRGTRHIFYAVLYR